MTVDEQYSHMMCELKPPMELKRFFVYFQGKLMDYRISATRLRDAQERAERIFKQPVLLGFDDDGNALYSEPRGSVEVCEVGA